MLSNGYQSVLSHEPFDCLFEAISTRLSPNASADNRGPPSSDLRKHTEEAGITCKHAFRLLLCVYGRAAHAPVVFVTLGSCASRSFVLDRT